MNFRHQPNDQVHPHQAFPNSLRRRSLLKGMAMFTLSQMLLGCQGQQTPDATIQLLQDSIPTPLLREFQRQHSKQLIQFRAAESLTSLYETLTEDENPTLIPAAATVIGDYWLTPAIRQHLIRPIQIDELDGWAQIPSVLKQLVTRDATGMLASDGQIWGAPYRWSSLAIAYQIEAFDAIGWEPLDWSVLWRPEVKQTISLPDSARIVIGLALKHLGKSWNAEDVDGQPLSESDALKTTLNELHAQVKVYSSSNYLQPFILGDTEMAVGWTTDLLPLIRRDRRFAAIIPESGTALTADVWVRPKEPETDEPSSPGDVIESILKDWIQFCWQPSVAQRISLQSFAASPMLIKSDRAELPSALRNDAVLLPEETRIDQSEFMLPLSSVALADYQRLWADIRGQTST